VTPAIYQENGLGNFWLPDPPVSESQWESAARAVASTLPDGEEVLARCGVAGLMQYVLGEELFGPRRYQLSKLRRVYYWIRPVMPRALIGRLRRRTAARAAQGFRLNWPVEDRLVHFLYGALESLVASLREQTGPPTIRFRELWPNGARFSFVLTHDVERASGQAFVRTLADLDERYGFRSSFNFVLDDYVHDRDLMLELRERGFEVGVHGLTHDGSLFSSYERFARDAQRINARLPKLGAVGFRSPSTHRNPYWMQQLEIEYDSSFFDTDPFETMPGGTMSIWPFHCGRFVELPYTLVQDHTLLVVLAERTPRLWADKVDFIARWGGMALLNAHPDYLQSPVALGVYEEFLQHMAAMRQRAPESFWNVVPGAVARWWRMRAQDAALVSVTA
jgi:peptidoglycan/xylan/chitin deacetylase (PgdA/CDA1 family)